MTIFHKLAAIVAVIAIAALAIARINAPTFRPSVGFEMGKD